MTDTTISMLIAACLCGFVFLEDVAEVYLVELIRDGDACGKEKTAFSAVNPSQKLISCVGGSAWVCDISCLIQFPVWNFSDITEKVCSLFLCINRSLSTHCATGSPRPSPAFCSPAGCG